VNVNSMRTYFILLRLGTPGIFVDKFSYSL